MNVSRTTNVQSGLIVQVAHIIFWVVSQLHIRYALSMNFFYCSSTTTSEVIRALLQKFKITDNPRKFALYEKIFEGDKCK